MTLALRELTKAGFTATWLAADETYTDRQRQTRTMKVSVFPGYLFVPFDTVELAWRGIHMLRGIKRVLGGDPIRPTALPHGSIDRLKAKFQAGEFKLAPIPGITKGDKIIFEAGPFAGRVGVVSHSRNERIKVMTEVLGDEREIEIWSGMVRRTA